MVAARNRQLLAAIFETLNTMVKLLDLKMDDDLMMFLINDPTLNRLTPLLQEMVLPGGFNELGNNG